MAVFGGWLFSLALQLQDGLGESALRAGLTFVSCGVAFALVSLNWRRLPARYHGSLVAAGFVVNAAGLVWGGLLLHSGGDGGVWLYVALAVSGGGMAGSFGALMGRVLGGVPLALAADASGVLVTVVQLGTVVGIAAFGALYLNQAGTLPAHATSAFALTAGHAYLLVSTALAGPALVGAVLAVTRNRVTARSSSALSPGGYGGRPPGDNSCP